MLWGLATKLHLPSDQIILILGLLTFVLTLYALYLLPDFFVRFILWVVTHTLYRIRIVGQENIPLHGAALLVSNHVSFVDALPIGASVPRFVRFMLDREYYDIRWLNWLFRLMMIRVEQGKGKKDRYTILSQRLLGELKRYKQTYQPVSWVFFGKNRNCPLDITAVQKVYNRAKQKSGVEKGKGIHTLRDCFATHLLEGGVDLVTIKTLLGHNSLQSTQRYLQIRQPKLGSTTSPLDLLDLRDPPL